MNIRDLLEQKQQTNEAPLGLMQRAGLGIKKAFGNTKAAGQLDTGKDANSLHGEYMNFIGKTGEEPEAANLIDFLKSKGYPTAKASQVLGIQPAAAPNPEADAAASSRKEKQGAVQAQVDAQDKAARVPAAPGAAPAAPKTAADIRAEKQAAAGKMAQDQMDANPSPTKPAVWKSNRNLSAPASTSPQAAAATAKTAAPAAQPAPDDQGRIDPTMAPEPAAAQPAATSAPAVWKSNRNLSAPASTSPQAAAATAPRAAPAPAAGEPDAGIPPADAAVAPAPQAAPAKPAARPQGGGKVPGKLSDNPSAVARREKRKGVTQKLGTPEGFEHDPLGVFLIEALTDQQIDAAILAASQEKAKSGGTKAAPSATAPAASAAQGAAAPADSGIPSAASFLKGKLTPDALKDPSARSAASGSSGGAAAPDSLDGIDKGQLKKALALVLRGEPVDDRGMAAIKSLYNTL